MAVPLLIVTPNAGFGELICQILEETGKYAIALATTAQETVAITKKDKPALCILETEMEGVELKELVGAIRQEVKDLLLILIPTVEGAEETFSETLNPDGFLSKPFYLPDLVTKVEEVLDNSGLENLNRVKTGPLPRPSRSPQPKADIQSAPEWLKDVSVAAQHLTSLSLESSSRASLITKGDQIWAYAGELPQDAVEELTQIVYGYFADGGSSDLARFISLAATNSEYMLYATWLGGGYVLAMVFDAEMPFSKIRSQASSLAQALSTPPGSVEVEASLTEDPSLAYPDNDPLKPLQPLLDDVPPPIPNDWIPESMVSAERKGFLDELLEDDLSPGSPKTEELSNETNVVPQVNVALDLGGIEKAGMINEPKGKGEVDYLAETMVSKVDRDQIIAETIQSRSTRDGKISKLEPVSPSLYNLTYACVLIPRFKHHHLTGAIATRLSDWISNMSVAFGWRLEHLAIRPEYIQWLVNVPPNTSPGYLMRTIRQHTSRRMFVEFPLLEEENPSGDFWAPGYLVMSGDQPPPAQLVNNFIQNTRKRQGVSK